MPADGVNDRVATRHVRPRKPRRLSHLLVLGILGAALAAVLALLPADPDDAGSGDGVLGLGECARETEAARLRGNSTARHAGGGEHVAGSVLVGRVLRGMSGVPAVVELRRLHDLLARHRWDPGPFDEGHPPSREDLLPALGHAGRIASVTTDAQGRFTLPIPGPGVYDVQARAADGATVRREVSVGTRREQVHITLDLPNGGETLTGSVLYEDGRPFTGRLLVERGRRSTHWSKPGSSGWVSPIDGRGTFTVRGLPQGSLALSVLQPGHLRLTNIPVVLPRKNALTITIPTSTTCEGRIVDAETHEPINGAHVTAAGYAWTGRTLLVHTTSDANGGFRIGGPAIASALTVEAAGYASTAQSLLVASASPLLIGLVRGGEPRRRLVPEGTGEFSKPDPALEASPAGWYLDVTVVSSGGQALPGAVVQTASRFERKYWHERDGRWTTDSRGQVRIGPLTDELIGIRASATDHVQPEPWDSDNWTAVARDGEATQQATTLVLDRGSSLAGRVTGPPGAPLERVTLVVDPDLSWTHAITLAAVDHDGRWSLPGGVGSRSVDLYAVLRWNGHTYHAEVDAEPGSQDVELVLQERDDLFPDPTEASGARIFDPQGRPATCGHAAIQEEGDKYWGHRQVRIASGRAAFHRPTWKSYYIEVWGGPGDLWGAGRFGPFAASETEPEIHLRPARSISGAVHDQEGSPQAGVRITARHPGYCGSPWYDRHEVAYAEAVTDPDGRFRLGGLGPDEYELQVHIPSTHEPLPAPIARGGTQDLEITLYPGVSAEVRIVDPEGRPVSGGWVEAKAKKPGANVRETVTDHFDTHGVARLLGLTACARYDLHVHPPGGGDGPFLPYVQKRWKPESTTIQLARAYSISGRVLDLTGTPLGDMEVKAQVSRRTARFTATTAPDGTFTLERLPTGSYALWTRPSGVQTVRPVDEWIFAEAGSQDVVLGVDPGPELIVHVEGWPEDQGAKAEMRADASQHVWYARVETNDPRTLRFRGVPEDLTLSVWIRNPRGNRSFHAFGHRLRAREVVTLSATEADPTLVRLLFPENVDVHTRRIWVQVERFSFYAGSKPSGGEARIEGVPDGVWPLRAYVEDARGRKWRGEGTASPGSRIDIVMRLDTD